MSTKPVNTRATTATCAGRVWHGVGHKATFLGRGSRNCCRRPTTQHTPAEWGAYCRQDLCHWAASL